MNCGFCGTPFAEDRGQPACRQCPVGSGCGLVRCPHCGYENPGTPGWITFLKKKLSRGAANAASGPARALAEAGTSLAAASGGRALPMLRPRP